MYNLIITALLIGAFFMSVLAFLWGLRIGKSLHEGIIPNVSLNPVKPIIEAIEQHKEDKKEKKLEAEFNEVMGATRESMLKSIKSEVK